MFLGSVSPPGSSVGDYAGYTLGGYIELVDQDTYCIDVLTQISAVDKALKGVAVTLLDGHLRHCVHDGVAAGGHEAEAIVSEATDAIARLVRA